ncbi:hypothetical protein [Nocardioides sp. LS1]|uniref:hypothetical protein n=1 Tax=Nocardioides sp. LS1 TaxID=1027620 RepID=UPI000FF91056|nr:hypothetical protein [Nocardioides sp. LS1]GCD88225.1 hypothetical protein NLS1_02310 [Nocardioides sp. LS1]
MVGPIPSLKMIGLVLVPAAMALLGDRNWWRPAWLDRILPHVTVEGPGVEAAYDELAGTTEEELVGR